MNSTDDKKAFGELKAKYEDWVYPDDSHRAIIAPQTVRAGRDAGQT